MRRLVVLGGLAGAAMAGVAARRRQAEARTELATAGERASLPPAAPAPAAPPEPPRAKAGRSREELYREAQAVGLKGRSKMTKAELEHALEEHARGG